MKYVQKPIEVEAIKLSARPIIAEDWFWNAVTDNRIITHNFGKTYPPAWCEIRYNTRENKIAACGDYIVLEPSGKLSVYTAEEFEAKHDILC